MKKSSLEDWENGEKKIIISNISINKNNQIKEALCRLHKDEEKWIYEKQKEIIYIIINDMSSLICIFSIEDGKMILIMIFAMLNKDKMIIIVTYNDFLYFSGKWSWEMI